MGEIWGSKEDWHRAAEAVMVAIKILTKSLVGADHAKDSQRLDELAKEGLDSLRDRDPARRYRGQD